MVLPVIRYGSPLLRRKSIGFNGPEEIKTLSGDMSETLKRYEGIGLAAPQVSLLKNIFIIDTNPLADKGVVSVEKVIVNPEIVDYGSDNSYYTEGCLSIPEIFEDILRPEKIEVRYRDENFDLHKEILDGILARIFQHEYDHLNGVLFIDRLYPLKRKLIQSRLKGIF